MKTNRSIIIATVALALSRSPEIATAQQSPAFNLEELQFQYQVEVAEKVAAPYKEAIARLNSAYLTGLERDLANVKSSGDLVGALALDTEIKRLASNDALPANDDAIREPLRKLRAIYRIELAKLEGARVANEAKLREPFLTKLKELEISLTKVGNLEEAKAVLDYRSGLAGGAVSPTLPVAAGDQGSSDFALVEWDGLTSPFEVGAIQFPNRDNVWLEVPDKYKGWRMSMPTTESKGPLEVHIKKAGLVFAVIFSTQEKTFQEDGWETVETLLGSGSGRQEYKMIRKNFKYGKQTIPIIGSFFGTRVLLPKESQKE